MRDWGSRDERRRRDASATCVGSLAGQNTPSGSFRDFATRDGVRIIDSSAADGQKPPSLRPGARAGVSFANAARGVAARGAARAARALLVAVRDAIDAEGSVVRPARPTLVRALAAIGGADETLTDERVPVIDGFSGRSARDAEAESMRALVEAATRGAAACLAALDDVADADADADADDDDENDADDVFSTATRRFSMSTRRAVSHALLDALGPATRRNGCVGDAFAPQVAAVFAKCLGSEKNALRETSFRKTGVCPRVAVRFAKIMRVPPALALPFPGAATELAEALVEAVAVEKTSPKTSPKNVGGATAASVASLEASLEASSASSARTRRRSQLAARTDAPASRAGAVAELLAWSGESAGVSRALVERLADACVDAGHASAAETLISKAVFSGTTETAEKKKASHTRSLRLRLAQTHADAGNHRAARRLAGESLAEELRDDSEEAFPFHRGAATDAGHPSKEKETDAEIFFSGNGLESALGARGSERVLLANDADSLAAARAWLERALARAREPGETGETGETDASTPIVGFDCEWRPGPGDARANPVTVAQFAAGGARRRLSAKATVARFAEETKTETKTKDDAASDAEETTSTIPASAVVLDCAAVFGPSASVSSAAGATAFVRRVFAECLLVGFGVAGDARRLVASYPERFEREPPALTAATVCVRDVATTLGGSADGEVASLSTLCAAVLGPANALDKTEQTSRWDERPLRASQIRYAALDALAPRLVLFALLEKRAARMFEGDVGEACRPWTKVHALCSSVKGGSVRGSSRRLNDASSSHTKEDRLCPRTDADVRAALAKLGALGVDEGDDATGFRATDGDDEDSRLRVVDGFRERFAAAEDERDAPRDSSGTHHGGSRRMSKPLLCKTLAVVAERVGDGRVELAATCVLPARDSVRLDMTKVAEALGVETAAEKNGNDDEKGKATGGGVRLRLANETELNLLFGFASGSVGPFGLRDLEAVSDASDVSDVSSPAEDDATRAIKRVAGTSETAVARVSLMDASLITRDISAAKTIAVGGGAPDVKVVGTARAVARHAKARVARIAVALA